MKKENAKNRQDQLLRHDRELATLRGFRSLAGVDEAGRGPLAGPVVAGAVIVRDFSFFNRVDDSKKMTALQRQRAFGEILAKASVGLGVVEHYEIDRLNILQATLTAMRQAVLALSDVPDGVVVDGTQLPDLPYPLIPIIDGDAKSFVIACASVVAKVLRDRMMDYYDGQYPEYGFARHRGYGTKDHLQALRDRGPCRIHRRSFEPVRSLIAV
ncbi:MAG: ribonuclease HII [Candidatus Omnitrophota bacterium]